MKKFLSVILVLALVLSLGAITFAEENTGSITITNATIDQTYSLYKIFDANIKLDTNGENAEAVAYSITTDNQFFEELFGADGTAVNTFFTYNPNTGSVTKNENVNDAELIAYLNNLVANGEYTTATDPVKATHEEVKFENLPYGYYLITSTLGTAVTINSNTPDVEVIDKNQEPAPDFDKQVQIGVDENNNPIWGDANSANIGDRISYRISFTATNYDGDKQIQYYRVDDEKGDAIWAEFYSIRVYVGGVELPRGYYLSQGGENTDGWEYLGNLDHAEGWNNIEESQRDRENAQWYMVHQGYDQFRVVIPWLEDHTLSDVTNDNGDVISHILSFPEGAESVYDSPIKVEIIYDAVIEATASIGSTTHGNRFNKASVSWISEYETGNTPPDEVVTQVYGIGLLKDDLATKANLAGAKFRIYKDEACTQPVYVIPTDIDGVYIIDSLGTPLEIVSGVRKLTTRDMYEDYLEAYLGTNEQDNYVVSQVNGKLVILGLAAGTYYLKEVEAPAGYNALSLPIEIKAGEGTRSFSIFADKDGHVADIQAADASHSEYVYDLTHTVVHNSKGTVLPSTGGEGTFWLITIGTMLAIGFAVFLITHKKMSVYTD